MKNKWNKILSLIPALITGSFYSLSTLAASAPVGELPFTGDHSQMGIAGIAMGIALGVIILLVVTSRRKK